MAACANPLLSTDAMHKWRLQIGSPKRRSAFRQCRPFAVLTYFVRGRSQRWPLVELPQVTMVALFDEQLASGRITTRLVGISGQLTESGLAFGGPGGQSVWVR